MHINDFKNYKVSPNDVVIRKAALVSDFQQHAHNFAELVLVTDGSGEHIIEDSSYPLNRGDVYVINPDVSHGFRTSERLEFYNIAFKPELALCDEVRAMKGYRVLFDLEPIYRIENDFGAKLSLEPAKIAKAIDLAEEMMAAQASKSPYRYTIIRMLTNLLVSKLSSWYDDQKENPSQQLLALSAIVDYIQNNLAQPLQDEILAKHTHYSVRHLRRLFKGVFHATPQQYIANQRIRLACRLLNESNLTVSEIGAKCGYQDCSYFIYVFNSFYKMTPKNYRKAGLRYLE